VWFNPPTVSGRRLLVIALVLGTLAAACSISVTTEGDPETRVDVSEPDRVDWRRTIAGFEIVGSGTDPDAAELEILARALAELPDQLVAAAHVRRIYRIPVGESPHGTAAYALGPNIYLIDETFSDLDAGMTTFDLVRLLAHEMAHTAQFAMLTDGDVKRASGAGLDDAIPSSDFVASFADALGWSDRGRASGLPDWALTDTSGTTEYGATAPEEDMAETVADAVTGTGPEVSASRIRWVTEWLHATADQLTGGRPWVPAGATRVVSEEPLYDVTEVQRRASSITEVVSYSLPRSVAPLAELQSTLQTTMAQRGVAGSLLPVTDDRVARVAGFFTRGDGTGYWVEIWDFRNAPGFTDPPPNPVVTYVVLWR
jgi:hypothetical protein